MSSPRLSGSRAGVVSIYQRYQFETEMRAALEAWAAAQHLGGLRPLLGSRERLISYRWLPLHQDFGLEGIVSKRLTAPYKSGPCKSWVKMRNPKSAAYLRITDGIFC